MIMNSTDDIARLTDILADRDFVLFDNDGVTYAFTPEIIENLYDAVVRTIGKFVADLSFEEIFHLSRESYNTHGSPYEYFMRKYGMAQKDTHRWHNHFSDHTLIPADTSLSAAFDHFHMPRAMLTHGNRDWAYRVLDRLDLRRHFSDQQIYAWEDVGFEHKSQSAKPFLHVLDREGYQAARSVMVEDSPANLVHPKQLGMTTIFVTAGKPVTRADYPHVDFIVNDLHDVMAAARDIHPGRRKNAKPQPAPNAPLCD